MGTGFIFLEGIAVKFFERFKWAVPKAFSDAVALCRFEEGDILYDTKKVYRNTGEWGNVAKYVKQSLQVKFPARATGGTGERSGGVFSRNWDSEVRLDLYEGMASTGIGQIETTQGRLYTLLWKGDLSVLDTKTDNPPVPLITRQVTKLLNETRDTVEGRFPGNTVFVMVRDLSNPVSRNKYLKVVAQLNRNLAQEVAFMSPKEAGLKDWDWIAPTVEIAFFSITGLSDEALTALIKKAVYTPGKNAKTDKFRLSAHGIIFSTL